MKGSAVLLALLLVLGAAEARAAEKTGAKAPDASKTLLESYKRFSKAESYRTKITVVGGVTESKLHRVSSRIVNDTYIGEVFGRVMEVANPKAFRTQERGAIRKSGSWKNLVAERDGARMDRLFVWPQVVMQRALKYRKTAEWVDSRKKGTSRKSSRKSSKDTTKSKSRTTVAKSSTAGEYFFPGTIRVEAPTREALKHVIEVENSGCLSGG